MTSGEGLQPVSPRHEPRPYPEIEEVDPDRQYSDDLVAVDDATIAATFHGIDVTLSAMGGDISPTDSVDTADKIEQPGSWQRRLARTGLKVLVDTELTAVGLLIEAQEKVAERLGITGRA